MKQIERVYRLKDKFSFIEGNLQISTILLMTGYITLFLMMSLYLLFDIKSYFLEGLTFGFFISGLLVSFFTRIWWLK